MPVELHEVKTAEICGGIDLVERCIDEHPDRLGALHMLRQAAHLFRQNMAMALPVKDKTQKVRPRVLRRQYRLFRAQAANLDLHTLTPYKKIAPCRNHNPARGEIFRGATLFKSISENKKATSPPRDEMDSQPP